jgi:hypothetical protein
VTCCKTTENTEFKRELHKSASLFKGRSRRQNVEEFHTALWRRSPLPTKINWGMVTFRATRSLLSTTTPPPPPPGKGHVVIEDKL